MGFEQRRKSSVSERGAARAAGQVPEADALAAPPEDVHQSMLPSPPEGETNCKLQEVGGMGMLQVHVSVWFAPQLPSSPCVDLSLKAVAVR